MSESEYSFDKFVEDIVRREEEQRQKLKEYAEEHADTPQRRYNDLYRERWQNRIRYNNPQPSRKK